MRVRPFRGRAAAVVHPVKPLLRAAVTPRRRRALALLTLAVGAGACSKNINIAPQGETPTATDAAAPPTTADATTSPPAQQQGDAGGNTDAGTSTHGDVCTFLSRPPSTPSSGGYDLARWRIPAAILPGTYEANDVATVLDKSTGLLWQPSPTPSTYDQAASDCVNRAAPGGTAGGQWRLPTRIELLSLLAWNGTSSGFPSAIWSGGSGADQAYWTTTPVAGGPDQRWIVAFAGTGVGPRPSPTGGADTYSALCVRDQFSGLSATPTFGVAADCGVVRDDSTVLEWQRDMEMITFESTTALDAHCAALALGPKGGRSGWRAPTIAELFTIVDTTRSSPAHDPALFTGGVAKLASGSMITLTGQLLAAGVHTDTGTRASVSPGDMVGVRCVREAL